jgi:hypothetical protein
MFQPESEQLSIICHRHYSAQTGGLVHLLVFGSANAVTTSRARKLSAVDALCDYRSGAYSESPSRVRGNERVAVMLQYKRGVFGVGYWLLEFFQGSLQALLWPVYDFEPFRSAISALFSVYIFGRASSGAWTKAVCCGARSARRHRGPGLSI